VIPDGDKLRQIASIGHGDLGQISFPVLLAALARARRTAVLELVRKPVEKKVFVVEGVPVDCRSNLVHETFGRFLVSQGKLAEPDFDSALAESFRRDLPIGEILLERRLLGPEELFRQLQQSLARKLLDGFTWREGTFRLLPGASAGGSELKVKVPQLILTGILKLTPLDEVTRAIGPLVSEPLAWNPDPPDGDLQLKGSAAEIAEVLRLRPSRLDELAAGSADVDPDDLGRIVYALALLEAIVPARRVATAGAARQLQREALQTRPMKLPAVPPLSAAALERARGRILEAYLTFRRKDAFELLGLPEEASRARIEEAFLFYAREMAPWQVEGHGATDLEEKARVLFLAGAESYAELVDNERRGALQFRRKTAREERARQPATGHRIETDLLDPEVQYKKGMELVGQGEYAKALELLQYAADLDAQNARYRADAAYCRYLTDPESHRRRALAELDEAVRADSSCGIAHYYLGLVAGEGSDHERAERHLQRAIKLMAPDRRPIDTLRVLTSKRGRR
jgi:tetratricopeptide (TPR) repeat protein